MRRAIRRRTPICCRHPWPLQSGNRIGGSEKEARSHEAQGARTGVLFCEPRSHPLRVLEEFVGAVHDTLLLQSGIVSLAPPGWASRPGSGDGKQGLTSFEDRALDVKSLQHAVKHRSTRFEYMRMKSCICAERVWFSGAVRSVGRACAADLLLLDNPVHVGLLGRVHL